MILDTDFLIAVIRKDEKAIAFIENIIDGNVELYLTHVNLWELYQGVFKSDRIQENLRDVKELINYFSILDFTKETVIRFGKLINELRKDSKQIGVMDCLIASVALENNQKIITRNIKHFALTGVLIEAW